DRRLPGQPSGEPEVPDPRTVTRFDALYAQNCAGCHGARGEGGAAIGLAAPGDLAIVPDDVLRDVAARGIPGTGMPASERTAAGMLTPAQIDALVAGIRGWGARRDDADPTTPPYRAAAAGDARRGADVFRDHCGSCHGANGRGGPHGGS